MVLWEAGGAWSHIPRAADQHGHPGRPARVVHLPGELRGHLHLLQVGSRPGGEEQQPQLSQWLLPDHGRAADPAAAAAVPAGRGGHAGTGVQSHWQPPTPVPVVQEPAPRGRGTGTPAPGEAGDNGRAGQLLLPCVQPLPRGVEPGGGRGDRPCREVMPCMGSLTSPLPQARVSSPLEAPGRRGMEVGGGRADRSVLLCPLCSPGTGGPWHSISLFPGSLEHGSPGQLYATDKVALLIGNMHYLHHKQLQAPIVDVHALGALLRQLDFKVVSLLDLRKAEMQMAVDEFLLLLDKGVYGATTPTRAAPAQGELGGFMLVESWGAARQGAGAGRSGDATMSPPCNLPSVPPAGLLYYAGHGYENFGNSFMVPIDAPSAYTSEHCLCVQRVLREMQQRRTGLNIFLLDMCRKRNLNDDVIPQVGVLEVTANIVFGYATCADAEAYELSQGELSNGIFVTFLKRWLMEDEKITVLLDKVAEDMGTLEITRGRQALELRSNLSDRRALTDPICPPGQDESSARNLQWAKAHVLPESRHLRFDCGVSVQLGFAAEFSNIMIIYTRVVAAPKDITNCEARLMDIPEELDVDLKCTNKESPEEVGSPLAPVWSLGCPSCCLYSRICGLQKLQQELAFTICLQYRYQGMDDFVEERQRVNVGRPLIAKLNLQRAASPSPPHSPLFSSPPRSWGVVGSPWVNTPEENLSPEGPSSHTL
ncbi:mucosa-associated lymphoid tissue lymphoma translocation protein 1 homolog isoform X9 [Corvus moneduloides]|uniref:mucosa-associated lymphoid tissue lymphoma translocation protein 1 homolog isoform X9 n=1 Tax=Corvus moneduloides TaxID=1196302 RepID=UPI00136209F2|nr:mucosa-associated lymphoid tissue lymphoma translocation protein 1 homolog isoform X9 [Corvus moneduloides]